MDVQQVLGEALIQAMSNRTLGAWEDKPKVGLTVNMNQTLTADIIRSRKALLTTCLQSCQLSCLHGSRP
jgi:hypothetical protein